MKSVYVVKMNGEVLSVWENEKSAIALVESLKDTTQHRDFEIKHSFIFHDHAGEVNKS